MLGQTKELAQALPHPWEKPPTSLKTRALSPSYVQRDYERMIRQIGTIAAAPKRRGKSPGRPRGRVAKQRPYQPIIKKSKRRRFNC